MNPARGVLHILDIHLEVPRQLAQRLLRIQLSAKGQSAIEKATSDMDAVGRRIADLIGLDRLERLMRLLDEVEERVRLAVLTS